MIAHMRKTDYKKQSVQEHLKSVSYIAGRYGNKVNVQAMAELAGFLHDMGKNTIAFSTYIENAVKETGGELEKIDHSTAGAKYLYERYYIDSPKQINEIISNIVVEIVGMIILSHHSGLQNFIQTDQSQSDFFRRVCKEELPYYEEVCSTFQSVPGNEEKVEELYQASLKEMKAFLLKLQQLIKQWQRKTPISRFVYYSILMKYIFSCLIDADRTDSRRFDEDDQSDLFLSHQLFFKQSYAHLMDQINEWSANSDASHPINQLRASMSAQCDRLAEGSSSIYQLSIPTGGGKTLASLRYALKHAQLTGKERIIYIVPYTTILEQNADAVRKVIKNQEMVLEHHANVVDDAISDEQLDYYQRPHQKQIQLARDNWDHPIIFTTMVQFLNTFYGKGTRKARRLHNLANAVVIFDEVQSVPVKHISLFNSAVNFLHYFGKSSIILCTATQPSLTATAYPLLMEANAEMVSDLPNVVKSFQRVRIQNKLTTEEWTASDIRSFALEQLEDKQSVLIIMNTKKAVLNVYQELKEWSNCSVYHLSTSMCPQHRKEILEKMKRKLDPKTSGEKVICVSTQLIEAGVDISFECVIRSLAGLDSVAQAAGRCNRNGEYAEGIVYMIRAQDETLSRLPEIELGQKVTEEDVLTRNELAEDLLSPAAIQTYFDYYLAKAPRKIRMSDSKLNIPLIELIDTCAKYAGLVSKDHPQTSVRSMYKTLESRFEVIEAPTTGVLVPYGEEGQNLIADLNEEIRDYDRLNLLLKKAQLFSVNVYSHTLRQLVSEELIYPLHTEGIYALRDHGYHQEFGLSITGDGERNLPIF